MVNGSRPCVSCGVRVECESGGGPDAAVSVVTMLRHPPLWRTSVFHLPPGHEAPPPVVVEYDAAAAAAADPHDWTRSIRDQIAAAFSPGAIAQPTNKTEGGGGGGGGGVIVPPSIQLMLGGGPVIVPPPDQF